MRERSLLAKKIWLAIHSKHYGSHVTVPPRPHHRETNLKCHTEWYPRNRPVIAYGTSMLWLTYRSQN